jgi:hypothetical protein
MRRASVATLLVALFALTGAAVAPTRGVSSPQTASVVWELRGTEKAPVVRHVARRIVVLATAQTTDISSLRVNATPTPVRHALIQRPPPGL